LAVPANAAGETWRGEFDQAVELAVAGDLDASLAILARLEEQHPDEPEIIRRSAQVLARSDRKSQAIERFQRLKQLSPDTFTDREQLLVLLLSEGAAESYEQERRELLAAFEAAGDRELTRSANFIRELFVIEKTVNVDAYEFYPNSRSGPLTPYYLFVLTDSGGALKGHFVVAENSEKTAKLKEQGEISETDGGYYLEFRRASKTSGGGKAKLITLFPGAHAPTYEQAREAVVAYISERHKS
jgi:tetratricopeptide (TPR) repeat protein